MTPEARARQHIDAMLARVGWVVQDRDSLNLHAGPGIAVRELPTATGPADYILFLDGRACAVLEAKPAGTTLLGVGPQAAGYAVAAPAKYPAWADPLPFYYLSAGTETLVRDSGDPLPQPRPVFAVHQPDTLRRMLKAPGGRLRVRLRALPPLDRARCGPARSRRSGAWRRRSPPGARAPWFAWPQAPARPTPPARSPTVC